ncbi:MAG: dTMP kinase [Deltaproteobacteria bacterium]|uniref:Thymidylate kinase n=1 Tax=Candidatus Zymogenus saltonus TaxID=2844893 RepID=A0A9D8KE43_9DELT|nr:dTMP kinase [Candidatus Zymogenus saltonus]
MNSKKDRKLKRGVLIVIEGIDGAGKSTQAERLLKFLSDNGYDALGLTEPTDGVWGKKIREMALRGEREDAPEEEYRLFTLDREENVEKNIAPALKDKKTVVLDRYYFSTMAYQGARGLDPRRIMEESGEFAPMPDLVFLIDIPVDESLKRIKMGRGGFSPFEREEYLKKVKEIFDREVAPLSCVVMVDGTKGEEAVFEEIRDLVMELLAPLTL